MQSRLREKEESTEDDSIIEVPDMQEEQSSSETSSKSVIESDSEIKNAVDAYKALINETVIHALSKDYSASMLVASAFIDAFCEESKFSWKRSAKLTGSLAIGAFASIYIVNTSTTASKAMQNAFQDVTGIDISYGEIITHIFQTISVSGSISLGTFCGMNLIETYLGNTSDAEKFLKYQTATCGETSKKVGKKVFDLFCAMAASVPSFILAQPSGLPLAILTAIANTSINWFGVSSLPIIPVHLHSAQRIEIAYLNEQLEEFLKLTTNEQNAILDEIDALRSGKIKDKTYKNIYARLLNLAKPISTGTSTAAGITIQEEHDQSKSKKALAIALAAYINVSQLNFIEATYAGINRLFGDTTSTLAITTGVIAAAFSVLPNGGFGYTTGFGIANALTTNNIPLAKLYLTKTREAIKYTIDILALFSSSTSLTLAMATNTDLVNLTGLTGTLKEGLTLLNCTIGYTTGAMVTAYYMQRLCDEILIYLSQRCADKNVRRLFTFVIETRRMIKILGETSEENYLEILRWKLTDNTDLTILLPSIFANRMTSAQYHKTQTDVNTTSKVLKDRSDLPAFRTTKSFVKETPEWQLKHPLYVDVLVQCFHVVGQKSSKIIRKKPS